MDERRIDIDEALSALDHMDDFARMANVDPIGPRNILLTFTEQVRNDRAAQAPAASAEPSDTNILAEWAFIPNSGDMRVDLVAFARALLSRYGRPAGDAQHYEAALRQIGDYAHDHSTGPAVPDALWAVRSLAYDALSDAPVAAQRSDDARAAIQAAVDKLSAITPRAPVAITYDRGWEIIDVVQKELCAAINAAIAHARRAERGGE